MSNSKIKQTNFFQPEPGCFTPFLKLPVRLMTEYFSDKPLPLTHLEAFIQILAQVRYQDTEENVGLQATICRRGESYRSLQAWSDLFHWSKFKTRYFFLQLKAQGIIELESLVETTRLRVIQYDLYTCKMNKQTENVVYSEDFETFWNAFHDLTQVRAVDKLPSFRAWKKLSKNERIKAQDKIAQYYYSLSKTMYCVKALTYLTNKKFNDQFQY